MRKLIIITLILIAGALQAQVVNAPIRGYSKLTDSIVSGKGQLTIKSDSVFRVLAYAYFPYMFTSNGDNSFTGLNTFSGYKNTFKSIYLTSGGNDTIRLTDNYSLVFSTADTGRIYIDNLGGLHLRDTIPSRYGKNYGWIYKGTNRFIHSYYNNTYAGRDSIASVTSQNLFIGVEAGNFTLAGITKDNWSGNGNVSVGQSTLKSLTTGYWNLAMGVNAGTSITTGANNFAMGNYSLLNVTTGTGNVALGNFSMGTTSTGSYGNTMVGNSTGKGVASNSYYANVGMGLNALLNITTGIKNTIIGTTSGASITTGSNNIFIGNQGYDSFGSYFNRGKTTTGNYNLLIGDSTVRVYNSNSSFGLSTDSTASRHLNIGNVYFARDTYTDTLKTGIGIREDSISARLHIKAGSTQRHTAPLKFNSGSLLTTPEVGAVEFLTDELYITQTTNTKRNRISIDRSDTLSTYASSVSVTMQGSLKQVTVSADCTLNATGGVAGSTMVLYLNCTALADKVITFGTNFKSKGTVTLVVATAATNEATVTFVCLDGTNWIETARSVGM